MVDHCKPNTPGVGGYNYCMLFLRMNVDSSLLGSAWVLTDNVGHTIRESAAIWKAAQRNYSINRLEGIAMLKALPALVKFIEFVKAL